MYVLPESTSMHKNIRRSISCSLRTHKKRTKSLILFFIRPHKIFRRQTTTQTFLYVYTHTRRYTHHGYWNTNNKQGKKQKARTKSYDINFLGHKQASKQASEQVEFSMCVGCNKFVLLLNTKIAAGTWEMTVLGKTKGKMKITKRFIRSFVFVIICISH